MYMIRCTLPGLLLAATLCASPVAMAAKTPASIPAAGGVLFPPGFFGTHARGLDQVDEIVEAADHALRQAGVREGIGAMMQHTILLKDGALSPLEVLGRFHAVARRLAPSLKPEPSVGTILRVPGFEDPHTLVGVDLSAAPSGSAAALARVPFKFGPQEIGQSIANSHLVFSAGLEAMDFEHGTLAPTLEQQIDAVTGKLVKTMQDAGVSVNQMVSHNLYVARGSDPLKVAELFHRSLDARVPGLAAAQSVGTLVVVDGMAGPGFKLEMDAIATRGDAAAVRRTAYVPVQPVARSVSLDGLVLTSSIDATPLAGQALPKDAAAQAEVVARRLVDAVKAGGGSAAGLVKIRLFVKSGNDLAKVHKAFADALHRAGAREPAYTVFAVEALENPALECAATGVAAMRR